MQVKRILAGMIETNCYIIYGGKCIIIDPGGSFDKIDAFLQKKELTPDLIILTHGHYDHFGALEELKNKYIVPFAIHEDEKELFKDTVLNGMAMFGMQGNVPDPDMLISECNTIEPGSYNLKILHTPGHTPGSMCIYNKEYFFAGDTLFREAVGRTDLPGGNYDKLKESLQKIKETCSKEAIIFPGHLSRTDITHEINYNPYLR